MIFKIEEMPSYRIAYMRQLGPYGINNLQLMENLKNWATSKYLLNVQSIILAIAHDNPETTKPENCRYDACIVISDGYQIDQCESINQGKISGGKYAVFQVIHTAEELQMAWSGIFSELREHGYHVDDSKPIFERYVFEMVNKHYCEICVPILDNIEV